VHAQDAAQEAIQSLIAAYRIEDEAPPPGQLVLERVTGSAPAA
jgi:hypothetical protein